MAGEPGYTVDEARADAREWAKDVPLGARGWRACGRILNARIEELEIELAALAWSARTFERDLSTYCDGAERDEMRSRITKIIGR